MWKNKYEAASKPASTGSQSTNSTLESGANQAPITPNQAVVHSFKEFQQYCTDCGEKNPTFHDEAACASCGTHLGSIDGALKMKACPSCGEKKIRPLTEEAIAKARSIINA